MQRDVFIKVNEPKEVVYLINDLQNLMKELKQDFDKFEKLDIEENKLSLTWKSKMDETYKELNFVER